MSDFAPMRQRIADALQAQPGSAKVTLDRRSVAYLLRVANESAQHTACRVLFQGKPDGWTCLDTLSEAARLDSNYMPEYRAEILAGKHLCEGCKLRAVIGE